MGATSESAANMFLRMAVKAELKGLPFPENKWGDFPEDVIAQIEDIGVERWVKEHPRYDKIYQSFAEKDEKRKANRKARRERKKAANRRRSMRFEVEHRKLE